MFSNSYDDDLNIIDIIHLFSISYFTSFETLVTSFTQLTMFFTTFDEGNGMTSNISASYFVIYDLCNDIGAVRVITSILDDNPITVYAYTADNYHTMATDVKSSVDLSKYIKISKSNNNIYGIYDMYVPSNTDSFFVILYNEDYSKYLSHYVNVSSCYGYSTSTIQNDNDIFILPSPPYFINVSIKPFIESTSPEMLEPEMLEPEMLEPEMLEPEMLEPEMLEPEMLEPEMLEPEMLEPEMLRAGD